ncbi:ParB/RepB/Spo0J family partition protein [Patescibacteria group bacterium]|nr:ParB/RepB/Spo0J family partition protein [Patescibacteria group bacterium]
MDKEKQKRDDQKFIGSLEVGRTYDIPYRLIKPYLQQPRDYFDPKDIQKKVDSMEAKMGPEEALRVVKEGTHVEIVSGETRWRAGAVLKLEFMPCLIQEFKSKADQFISAMKSNINQTPMLALEEARGFAHIMKEKGWNQNDLAKELGIKQATISSLLVLLNLNENLTKKMACGELNVGIAKIAAKYPKRDQGDIYRMWIDLRIKIAKKNNKAFTSVNIAPNTFTRLVERKMLKKGVEKIPTTRGRGRQLTPVNKNMRAIIRHCEGLEEELSLLEKETAKSLHTQKTPFTELMLSMEKVSRLLEVQSKRITDMDGWRPEDED